MFLFKYPDRTKITILKLLMFIFVLLAVAVFLSILWYLRPGSWQTCLVFLIADGMFLPFSLSFLFDFIFRERLAPFLKTTRRNESAADNNYWHNEKRGRTLMKHYKTLSYLLNSHSLPELEQFGTGNVRDEKMSFVDPLLALNTFRALYDLVQHNMPLFDGDDVLSDLDALILVLEDAVKLQSEVCLVIE